MSYILTVACTLCFLLGQIGVHPTLYSRVEVIGADFLFKLLFFFT